VFLNSVWGFKGELVLNFTDGRGEAGVLNMASDKI
jgi:hypothetical protein